MKPAEKIIVKFGAFLNTILSPVITKVNSPLHSFYIKLCNRNIELLTSSLFSSYVVIYYFYL